MCADGSVVGGATPPVLVPAPIGAGGLEAGPAVSRDEKNPSVTPALKKSRALCPHRINLDENT